MTICSLVHQPLLHVSIYVVTIMIACAYTKTKPFRNDIMLNLYLGIRILMKHFVINKDGIEVKRPGMAISTK